jgi:hypothetical protein
MTPSKKTKKPGGWAYVNRTKRGMKAILIFISGEAHARLRRKAYLEERTLQKVARRLVEEGVKDTPLPEKGEGEKL